MTVVHIICHNWRRHLAYALLCIKSLIENGAVEPKRIIVSVSKRLVGTLEYDLLEKLGCQIRQIDDAYTNKLIELDAVFRGQPFVNSVIQLDADCYLTESCNFIERLGGMENDNGIALYQGHPNGEKMYFLRKKLFIPGFHPDESPENRRRLTRIVDAVFGSKDGSTYGAFESRLSPWFIGGLVVVSRGFVKCRYWESVQAMAQVVRCEEIIFKLVDCYDKATQNRRVRFLSRVKFPHHVSPERLSFSPAPGIVHYAGDWYREHNTQNRSYIESELVAAYGIGLPTDAPVGPRKLGDPHTNNPTGTAKQLIFDSIEDAK